MTTTNESYEEMKAVGTVRVIQEPDDDDYRAHATTAAYNNIDISPVIVESTLTIPSPGSEDNGGEEGMYEVIPVEM